MLTVIEKVRRMVPLVAKQGGKLQLKTWAFEEIRRRRDTLPGVRYDAKAKRLYFDDVELIAIKPRPREVYM